jgi:hypothetical protein
MKALRWLAFIPVGFAATGIGQLGAAYVANAVHPWIAAWGICFLGVFIIPLGMVSVTIAPQKKVGLWLFLPLFLVFEFVNFTKSDAPAFTGIELFCRIVCDMMLVLGMVGAAFKKKDSISD